MYLLTLLFENDFHCSFEGGFSKVHMGLEDHKNPGLSLRH